MLEMLICWKIENNGQWSLYMYDLTNNYCCFCAASGNTDKLARVVSCDYCHWDPVQFVQ